MPIKTTITGDDMQLVELTLDPQTIVRAEPGSMLFMEQGITMETTTGGGLWKGVKRMLTGDSLFISSFTNVARKPATVAFAAPYPGKIIPLDTSTPYLCQRDTFLCAEQVVDIDIAFTKRFGAGFFGGEGFILQKLFGNGTAYIHAGGTIIKKILKANEHLRVDTGCLVAFQESVTYDIQFIGGFKNALFGGEGIFLALLQGPGIVYLQSLPFSRLADRIYTARRVNRDESKGVAGIGRNVLGGILGGDNNF